MRDQLARVITLQREWQSRKTPAMDERGKLVRKDIRGWLERHSDALATQMGVGLDDFLAQGGDGTGRKTRVPWVRFASQRWSPKPTEGFYVVYLWAFDGSAVYLSLNQGTTDFINGEFVPKPKVELERRVAWARGVLSEWLDGRGDIVTPDLADLGENSLGRGYELGDIASVRYADGAVPDETVLLSDAVSFAGALGALYAANERAPLPYEVPEVIAAEEASAAAAGRPSRQRGAGFRQSKEERDLIELRAMDVAAAYYEADGWKVARKGAPYDLDLVRGSEELTVEVKGTTSMGEAVVLTDGEVRHHSRAYPNNALVIVRDIRLDRSTTPPTVTGGVLFEIQPWTITDDALSAISYRYAVPIELYEQDGMPGELFD